MSNVYIYNKYLKIEKFKKIEMVNNTAIKFMDTFYHGLII